MNPRAQGHQQPNPLFILWVFVALFLLLGLGYSTLTPIFENSDETLHYPYVKNLADGRGLPLAEPGRPWNQEATQPPLYYAVVAASTFWIDSDNLPAFLQLNPHWLFTEVRALVNDNQNRVLHGPAEAFPYRRAALAIHIGRWWSLFFGAVTVGCTFFICRQLFPKSLALATTTTALVALTPQFLRVSATVSNDSLSAALASLTVLAALKFTEPAAKFGNRHALALGLLSGLALMTKLSSLSTFFLAAAVIFWRCFLAQPANRRSWVSVTRWLALAGAVVLALNGWYFWRNYHLYGEWLATETHLNLAGRGHLSPAEIWSLRAEIARAYWASFGWGQIRLPEWMYTALNLFAAVGLAGLVWGAVRALARRPDSKNTLFRADIVIFLLFWAALNVALYVQWITQVGSVSHTRLIFPAITAISLLVALGWHLLVPRRFETWLSIGVTALLLALNIYSLGWLIGPAFTPHNSGWPSDQPANTVNATFANSLNLSRGNVEPLHGGQMAVWAEWQTRATVDKNYSVSAVLLAPNGAVLAHRETYPGLGLRPTTTLTRGQNFVDVYPLQLEQPVQKPMVARAVIGLFDVESDDRAGKPALDSAGNEITPVVGQIKLTPEVWPAAHPQQSADVNFGDAIRLAGFDHTPDALTLYWESLAPVSEDFSLFIHLLDAGGNVTAQADAPLSRDYPTSWWSPGETVSATYPLPAAPDATNLRLGVYSLSNGQRLPVRQSSLPAQDDGVTLKP